MDVNTVKHQRCKSRHHQGPCSYPVRSVLSLRDVQTMIIPSDLYRAERPRFEPRSNLILFVNTYHRVLSQSALLFCPLVLRICPLYMVTVRIGYKKASLLTQIKLINRLNKRLILTKLFREGYNLFFLNYVTKTTKVKCL